ncbi:MAG: S-layer homology domain-containing protein [Eubacteriales bacterium]|nr:S-layer homology domain-containing protein [Eubacteriales bacterium]
MKRAGAWLITAALTVGLLPGAGAAVSSDNAKSYLKALDNAKSSANSFLIDFNGDGNDELLLIWQDYDKSDRDSRYFGYSVWQGSKKLVQVDDMAEKYYAGSAETPGDGISLAHCSLATKGNQLFFIEDVGERDSGNHIRTYTVRNGQWSLTDTFYKSMWAFTGDPSSSINGQDVDETTFANAYSAYSIKQEMMENGQLVSHSVRTQLANAVDTSTDGYEDVLSSLSASEKQALFTDLLGSIENSMMMSTPYDYQTTSDADIISALEWFHLNSSFSFADYGGDTDGWSGHTVFSQADFTKLTNQLFNRTIDYSKYTRTVLPDINEMKSFLYQGKFYLMQPQAGYVGYDRYDAQHLYLLGGNKYMASYKHWYAMEQDHAAGEYTGAYTAVVKKNADGTWTLLRLYPKNYTPTAAELAAFVQPSSWAKAEVEAAQAAGLVPALTGDPGWQDSATRLQFAELAVQLAEQATGKTLSPAPSSTFADTKSVAVLKAYQAGIVNGTSDTAFSPYNSLTREQLATMLWRAVSYVQKETGKSALASGGDLSGFSDANKVSSWAKDAVSALAHNGVMKGTSATQLSPADSCTVEQSVLLVYRTFEKLQ